MNQFLFHPYLIHKNPGLAAVPFVPRRTNAAIPGNDPHVAYGLRFDFQRKILTNGARLLRGNGIVNPTQPDKMPSVCEA